ncbi:MAG: hypothetical protein ACI86M_001924 [Saprospiraceae bacterium]|jgi:hypothetical protein
MLDMSRTNKIVLSVFCVVSMTILFSFSQSENTESDSQEVNSIPPLVQQNLKEKLEKFKNTILRKCKREAIEAAEIFVDSLVSVELKLQANDTIFFPAKPVRPMLPEKIILNDSTDIDPIF